VVASLSHAYRERAGGVCDRRGAEVVRGGGAHTGGVPEPPVTDITDSTPVQGKPQCITRIFYNHYIYICGAFTLQEFYDTHMHICIYL
jgi:hypothetical protein